jgi:cytochrome c oxidase accessory protein FixG
VVMFDFGWFREQFCLVACPYGRMQSVFMDQGSFFLAYDEKRKDCIECGKCVAVCPTGIDVRQGLQFECIACTACADACDSVMSKIKKPKGLIGYGNLLTLQGLKTRWFRARVWVYGVLLVLVTSGFVYRLSTRQIHQLEVIRAVDTPYQQVKDPDGKEFVINHFKIRFYNLDWNTAKVDYTVSELARVKGIEMIRAPSDQGIQIVTSGGNALSQFFLKVPKSEFVEGSAVTSITGVWDDGEIKQDAEVKLVGPWK